MSHLFENWIDADKDVLLKRIDEIALEIDKLKETYSRLRFKYSVAAIVVLAAAILVFFLGYPLYALLLILSAGLIKLYAAIIVVSGQADVIVRNQLIDENILRYFFSELARIYLKKTSERNGE